MTRSRYLKIILLILISTQMSFLSFGQLDNEWFDPSQRYFTFKIGQNGVYRLDYNTLLNFGIPIDEINPKTIQIFKNGEEQYLFVSGQDDNNFDINDFIEFYATKNEGFSLPSIEAMASGCLVIGYPGKGGKEYFKSEFSMPVPEKDIQSKITQNSHPEEPQRGSHLFRVDWLKPVSFFLAFVKIDKTFLENDTGTNSSFFP